MAVVHFSNVHYPYYVDKSLPQPFQPATTSKAPEKNPSFFRYYENAVYQQDLHLADIVRAFRATPMGKRTVIVYTSDHGEAFREHGQMGHTFSVLDEEVHVPAWIDAPPGTLDDSEEKSLEAKKDAFVSHIDIAPTILDLMGVWDDPAIAKYRTRMPGHSLLRPAAHDRGAADDELRRRLELRVRELGLSPAELQDRGARVGHRVALLRSSFGPAREDRAAAVDARMPPPARRRHAPIRAPSRQAEG